MIFPGYFTLFLALDRQLPEAEHCTTHLLTEEDAQGLPGILHPSINVQVRSRHYPELSPPGTSVIFATYFCDIAPWRALNEGEERVSRVRKGKEVHTLPVRRGGRYAREKKRVAELMTTYLDKKYPGLASSVVSRDISTPLTQLRYTGNYNGTVLQWQPFVEGGETLEKEINKNGPMLPGLKNFYMSGVWVTSGGLIRAAVAGRHVMQFICKEDGKAFTAHLDDKAPLPTQAVIPEAAALAKMAPPARPASAGLGAPQGAAQADLGALATGPEGASPSPDASGPRVQAPTPATQQVDL